MNSTTKRGQAAGAAVLIAIIAGLLIMFIVLVSPEERAQLLGEDDSDYTTDSESDIDGAPVEKNLLQVSPGRVDYLAQREIEHPLPAINVYTKTEGQVLAEKNLAYAKKGVFSEEVSKFSFSVPDLQNTENLLLSLTVNSLEGRLIISLKG